MSVSYHAPDARQRKKAIQRWKRRSAVVRFWRKVLPLVIAGVVIALGGWIVARGLLPAAPKAALELAAIRMKNPKIFGRDNNDRAFLLAARDAVRDALNEKRIVLSQPTFHLGAGSVRADQGIYVEGEPNIILRGHVVVVDNQGARMQTDEALIDTRTGVVTNSRSPAAKGVQIENRMGKISASDYTVSKDGTVHFSGGFHGVITPR